MMLEARNRWTTTNCNVIGAYSRVYCYVLSIWIMLDLVGRILVLIHSKECILVERLFGPRKYVGGSKNALETLGYVFTGLWGVSGL